MAKALCYVFESNCCAFTSAIMDQSTDGSLDPASGPLASWARHTLGIGEPAILDRRRQLYAYLHEIHVHTTCCRSCWMFVRSITGLSLFTTHRLLRCCVRCEHTAFRRRISRWVLTSVGVHANMYEMARHRLQFVQRFRRIAGARQLAHRYVPRGVVSDERQITAATGVLVGGITTGLYGG